MVMISASPIARLGYVLDLAWAVFFERIVMERVEVNKEASMQLHYASTINDLGQLMCVEPDEVFELQLERDHQGRSIDITCRFRTPERTIQAAVELKCFRKQSNRALDLDMYDVLKDIERILSYTGYQVRRFICLTDDARYTDGGQRTGYAEAVSIGQGRYYRQDSPIVPPWIGKWKDKSRDHEISLSRDVRFDWMSKEKWHFLKLDL